MKKQWLQIGSLLMALYVLFMAHGFCVNFHFCSENHHVMSSFGDASLLCSHCLGHHDHHEHLDAEEAETDLELLHFEGKCCCEDFNSEIGHTDDYTFSTEKPLMSCLVSTPLTNLYQTVLHGPEVEESRGFAFEKIPYLLTGRLRTLFFSQLKLNPLVF
ncbi:MAG: hypothetical protein J6W26_07755 [Bacteroidales bacterium]|nr:hypothetical protein [Bacteroidales bacterium]